MHKYVKKTIGAMFCYFVVDTLCSVSAKRHHQQQHQQSVDIGSPAPVSSQQLSSLVLTIETGCQLVLQLANQHK